MKLYTKASPLLGENEDLVLHLSEPSFTRRQRLARWITLLYLRMRG